MHIQATLGPKRLILIIWGGILEAAFDNLCLVLTQTSPKSHLTKS